MRVLETADGTLINAGQITTAARKLDGNGYELDALRYFRMDKEIEKTQDSEEKAAYERARDQVFPNGRPVRENYYKTLVHLSDGERYWVDRDLTYVKLLIVQS